MAPSINSRKSLIRMRLLLRDEPVEQSPLPLRPAPPRDGRQARAPRRGYRLDREYLIAVRPDEAAQHLAAPDLDCMDAADAPVGIETGRVLLEAGQHAR